MTDNPKTSAFPLPDGWRPKAIKKLNTLVKNGATCPVCAEREVFVSSELTTPMAVSEEGAVKLGGTIYPQLQLLCRNCGFARYFNYVLLMEEKEQAGQEEA